MKNTARNTEAIAKTGGSNLLEKMVLEVPVQKAKIPQSIIDCANDCSVFIRDINGKFYNNPLGINAPKF